jgi:hypothetical protein
MGRINLHTMNWLPLVMTVLTLSLATAANAEVTAYDSPSAFQASAGNLTSVNFNGIVGPNSFKGYSTNVGYTDPTTGTNFNFSQPNAKLNLVSSDWYNAHFGNVVFPGDVLTSSTDINANVNEVLTLPAAVQAFSLDFSSFGGSYQFLLSNGDTVSDPSPPAWTNFAFFSFTDTVPFSSVTIVGNSGTALLDVSFTSVPEPSSLLLGAGLGAAWFFRRR